MSVVDLRLKDYYNKLLYLHQVASVDLVEVLVLLFRSHVVLCGTCLAEKGPATRSCFVDALVDLGCTDLLSELCLHLFGNEKVLVLRWEI